MSTGKPNCPLDTCSRCLAPRGASTDDGWRWVGHYADGELVCVGCTTREENEMLDADAARKGGE